MAKGTQFIPAIPAPGAELFRGLADHVPRLSRKGGKTQR
jgi:hypothetical protein